MNCAPIEQRAKTTAAHFIRRDRGEAQRGAGKNLLVLLDVPACRRVLIVGRELERWQEVIPGSRFLEDVQMLPEEPAASDLVLYHCGYAVKSKDLECRLSALHRSLSPSGRLLLFAPNAYSFRTLKKVRDSLSSSPFRGSNCGRRAYRQALIGAGFVGIQEYIALPTLDGAEEMVAAGSRFLELPHYWHPVLHLARRCGLFPAMADGYVFIAGHSPLSQSGLFGALARLIPPAGHQGPGRWSIERFDLRLRGALALFAKEEGSGRRVIVRVVSDLRTREIVSRNQGFLSDLQANPGLPSSLKALLPRPMGESALAGSTIYVESLLEGILAWKVNGERMRKRIRAEAADFIFRFQTGTRRKVRLSAGELEQLFASDLERLESCPTVNPFLRDRVFATANKIRQALHGREIFLVASHGDYGYGNVLVDARTGELKGVIDWDTGRLCDLPGLDFVNLEVQRIGTETGCELAAAFEAIFDSIIDRDSFDPERNYEKHLGVSADLVPALIHLALVRYLTRAAQYPEVFYKEQQEYLKAFEALSNKAQL